MSEVNLKLLEDLIAEDYGPRCPDFEGNCIACLAWAAYDALANRRPLPSSGDLEVREVIEELKAACNCADNVDAEQDYDGSWRGTFSACLYCRARSVLAALKEDSTQ